MTKEEQDLMVNQASVMSQHEYIASLIKRDMFIFVNKDIRQRLSIPKDLEMTYDVNSGKVFVHPKMAEKLKN